MKVVISKQNFPNLTNEYNALIDTGAVKSFISNTVKDELQLETIGIGSMNDANNNTNDVELVKCNILLEDHSSSVHLEVAIFPGRKECDVIIGMDMIEYGELLIKDNHFLFTIKQLI